MRQTILSIDPSTKMGLVVLDVVGLGIDCILREEYSSKLKGMERLGEIGQKICDLLEEYKPTHVIIEGYSFASKHNLVTMAEVGTVIRYFLWQADYDYIEIAPTTLKKFMGKGNYPKEMMRLRCFQLFNFEHKSNDVVDAYCLAMMGVYAQGDFPLYKYQYEAIMGNADLRKHYPCQLKLRD